MGLGPVHGALVRLIAAGAVALACAATETAQAAPAPVPCTNIGGGHYECGWYVPGDGVHGGSLVAVGTTTVGYLHKGRNWIVCQQTGGDVRNAADAAGRLSAVGCRRSCATRSSPRTAPRASRACA